MGISVSKLCISFRINFFYLHNSDVKDFIKVSIRILKVTFVPDRDAFNISLIFVNIRAATLRIHLNVLGSKISVRNKRTIVILN